MKKQVHQDELVRNLRTILKHLHIWAASLSLAIGVGARTAFRWAAPAQVTAFLRRLRALRKPAAAGAAAAAARRTPAAVGAGAGVDERDSDSESDGEEAQVRGRAGPRTLGWRLRQRPQRREEMLLSTGCFQGCCWG